MTFEFLLIFGLSRVKFKYRSLKFLTLQRLTIPLTFAPLGIVTSAQTQASRVHSRRFGSFYGVDDSVGDATFIVNKVLIVNLQLQCDRKKRNLKNW
jgi:hypothetical protein